MADLGLSTVIKPDLDERKRGLTIRPYYLVPVDDTTRINDRAPQPDVESSAPETMPSPKKLPSSLPKGVEGFFGLGLETRLGVWGGPNAGVFGTEEEELAARKFVPFEPCRIGMEFWGVQALKDKQRLCECSVLEARVRS
jgi:hypothetical protein